MSANPGEERVPVPLRGRRLDLVIVAFFCAVAIVVGPMLASPHPVTRPA